MTENYLIASLGSIGRRHLTNLRALRPDARIAVWRSQAGPGAAVPVGADLVCHTAAEAIAFAPRAAIVASPASLHLAQLDMLTAAGVPVLVEKPLADTLAGVEALVDRLAVRRTAVAVGYNMRLLASLQQVRTLLAEGAIGEVLSVRAEVGQYLPDWRPGQPYAQGVSAQRALGGGALLELSHEIDYLLWLLGMPQAVSAQGGRLSALNLDVEDTVELCLAYSAPRRLVSVHLDFLQRAAHRSCRFIGSEGTLVWQALDDRVELYRAATGAWTHQDFTRLDRNQVYVDELKEFLALIDGGLCRLTTAREGLNVLRVIEAARQSMAEGRTVEIAAHV